MPPRFTYWTIILEGKPTAFRANTQEELLPTLKQLQSKHPDAVLMWFARGRLWPSEEEARAARVPARRASAEVRGGGPVDRTKTREPNSRSRAMRSESASASGCSATTFPRIAKRPSRRSRTSRRRLRNVHRRDRQSARGRRSVRHAKAREPRVRSGPGRIAAARERADHRKVLVRSGVPGRPREGRATESESVHGPRIDRRAEAERNAHGARSHQAAARSAHGVRSRPPGAGGEKRPWNPKRPPGQGEGQRPVDSQAAIG